MNNDTEITIVTIVVAIIFILMFWAFVKDTYDPAWPPCGSQHWYEGIACD